MVSLESEHSIMKFNIKLVTHYQIFLDKHDSDFIQIFSFSITTGARRYILLQFIIVRKLKFINNFQPFKIAPNNDKSNISNNIHNIKRNMNI